MNKEKRAGNQASHGHLREERRGNKMHVTATGAGETEETKRLLRQLIDISWSSGITDFSRDEIDRLVAMKLKR